MTFRMNGNCITPVCAHMLFTRVSLSITIEDNLQLLTAIKTEHINAFIIYHYEYNDIVAGNIYRNPENGGLLVPQSYTYIIENSLMYISIRL